MFETLLMSLGNLLQEHNKLLKFDRGSELFAQNNSGRLVSKFLTTFTGPQNSPEA